MKISQLMGQSKGQAVTIVASRPLHRRELAGKNKERVIIKHSFHNAIWGVERDRKAAVIEARANGDAPAENQGMKGKKWIDYPFVLESEVTKKKMVRVYPAKNGSRSTYTENGKEISYDEYVAATIPSLHNRERTKIDTYDLTLDSIEMIKAKGKSYAIDANGELTELE